MTSVSAKMSNFLNAKFNKGREIIRLLKKDGLEVADLRKAVLKSKDTKVREKNWDYIQGTLTALYNASNTGKADLKNQLLYDASKFIGTPSKRKMTVYMIAYEVSEEVRINVVVESQLTEHLNRLMIDEKRKAVSSYNEIDEDTFCLIKGEHLMPKVEVETKVTYTGLV